MIFLGLSNKISKLKKSHLLLPLTTMASAAFMIGLVTVGFLVLQLSAELPNAQSIRSIQLKVPLRVYSADKLLISEFGNERRKPVELDSVPKTLIDSILAAEDDGFFDHQGIDPKGLFRAAISNFQSGKTRQGASTITMQVARNFFLSPEKTYIRKLREILLAIKLEQLLSKEEILSLYINKIFLGHRSYGFGAAAEVYYGKPLHELDLAQIAMLAGLPKAPSSYNPLRNPARAVQRRNYVLDRLQTLKRISREEYQATIDAPVTAQKHARATGLAAPHIAEMVRAQLTEEFGEQAYWQGLNVYTTIQSTEQMAADQALRVGLKAYDRRHGFRGPIAKLDLEPISTGSKNSMDAYADALAIYPSSHEQVPAVVISNDQESAIVQTQDHGAVTLSLESSSWAKRHITANRIGDAPTAMNELLALGDVVYIEPIINKDIIKEGDTNASPQHWRLSQIPNVGGALISMQPKTGRILSLVGGYDFFLNKYNRAVQSIRQPGSNIKPFIYSASLDKGFTPASLISGAPIVMTDPAHGTIWRPENYSGKFFGPTRMREALGKSMNLVSIRLLRSIGIPYAREYTERFGIDMNRFSPTLTMALGAGGITPLEMLSAYSVLANGGYKVQPTFIDMITDRAGNVVYRAETPEFCDACYADYLPKPEPVNEPEPLNADDSTATEELSVINDVEPETEENELDLSAHRSYQAPRIMNRANNFFTVSMLKDVVKHGTARKALVLERQDLAGKTGTTNDYVDAWFTGFNSKIATTVWIGFDKPASLGRGEAGSVAALPIWIDYMRTGLDNIEQDTDELPDYIEEGFVDRATGKRTDEFDPQAVKEYFAIEALLPERALIDNNIAALEAAEAEALAKTDEEELLDDFQSDQDRPLEEPPTPINQDERIIETEEETEGLF